MNDRPPHRFAGRRALVTAPGVRVGPGDRLACATAGGRRGDPLSKLARRGRGDRAAGARPGPPRAAGARRSRRSRTGRAVVAEAAQALAGSTCCVSPPRPSSGCPRPRSPAPASRRLLASNLHRALPARPRPLPHLIATLKLLPNRDESGLEKPSLLRRGHVVTIARKSPAAPQPGVARPCPLHGAKAASRRSPACSRSSGRRKYRVNGVAPGYVLAPAGTSEAAARPASSSGSARARGERDDVAGGIVYSERASRQPDPESSRSTEAASVFALSGISIGVDRITTLAPGAGDVDCSSGVHARRRRRRPMETAVETHAAQPSQDGAGPAGRHHRKAAAMVKEQTMEREAASSRTAHRRGRRGCSGFPSTASTSTKRGPRKGTAPSSRAASAASSTRCPRCT